MIREALQANIVEQNAIETKKRQEAAERAKPANGAETSVKTLGSGAVLPASGEEAAVPSAVFQVAKSFLKGLLEYRYWILGVSVVLLALLLSVSRSKPNSVSGRQGRQFDPPLLRQARHRGRRHHR